MKIPIRLISEANTSSHWRATARRKKNVKETILKHLIGVKKPELPLRITFCRIAPRSLDSADNLGMSLKKSIDTVCGWLLPNLQPGFADGDPRIEIKTSQRKGVPKEYALEIKFESL